MWVPTADLPKSAGHPFYERLNRVLDEAEFDAFVEAQCASFYADGVGRPSLAPGRYFRLLLLGYFEGLDSERAIAWRAADSLSIRAFLDYAVHEAPPDHSTLSRTRRLIDLETHQAVFTWVLQRLADATLVVGRTVGIDATTLEANAAMRSIVRRDTGESYDAFLTRLAEASGLSTPTRAELARFDRTRKKKGSNDDWTHPHDPDAKITKMKDGRTHLAHTAEHAVDLETGAIVGVTVQDASAGDTTTLVDTLVTAAEQVEAVGAPGIAEIVADKGYHSNETMVGFAAIGVRSYVSEPDRGRRNWKGQAAARDAVYANRRRIRGARGKRLLRQRGELLERPNAHLYETGRMRRVHLRGHPNILKRVLVQVCGVKLGLLMRHLTGVGTPRSLQDRAVGAGGGADRPPERLLGACATLLGPGAPLSARFVVGWSGDTPIRTRDSRLTISPFCHGLLAVPKAEELVATPYRHGSREAAETFFLKGMTRALRRVWEQAHCGFPVTIYCAFKQSERKGDEGTASTAWETFLDAVIRSGFGVAGTWPMRTELGGRSNSIGTNALASSIVLICRRRPPDALSATRGEFLTALRSELPPALRILQSGNVAPVDLAQAAIGPGMAVYTRYAPSQLRRATRGIGGERPARGTRKHRSLLAHPKSYSCAA